MIMGFVTSLNCESCLKWTSGNGYSCGIGKNILFPVGRRKSRANIRMMIAEVGRNSTGGSGVIEEVIKNRDLDTPTTSTTVDGITMEALKELMGEGRDMIEAACDSALGDIVDIDSREARLVEMMRYALLGGGKRVRGLLVMESCRMFIGDDMMNESTKKVMMAAAVAVEMVHAMSLVHDDLPCMDNDEMRRGKLSCHRKFGESMAVLAGDALLAKAFEVLAKSCDHDHLTNTTTTAKVSRVLGLLAEGVGQHGLAGGQVMDIVSEGKDDIDIETLEWIHAHKTAALLRVSCQMGAIIGGANEADVENVSQFALKIGLAFQVVDDVLDVTASTKTLGKTVGKDRNMDKTTYPKLLGVEGARVMAEKLVEEAKATLKPYGNRANVLLGLADFILKRKR